MRIGCGFRRLAPAESMAALVALATVFYVVAAPFVVARYPMMTDLPFHAANASILRHHLDPAWHFREQFALQPFAVPYLSLYLIAGAAMTFVSPVTAIKLAAVVMLLLLPAGLAVLAWGMGKSPLLGLAAVGLCWGDLAHWGFVSFLGALGLFAMALGLTLRQLAAPKTGRAILLTGLLVALFFTHPFRFPFALAAVAGAALLVYPATRRFRPIAIPLLVNLALFAAWWSRRAAALELPSEPLSLHFDRLAAMDRHLFGGLLDPRELLLAERALYVLIACGIVLVALAMTRAKPPRRLAAFRVGSHLAVFASALAFLGLYLALPMEIGLWWYVFPREITASLYLGLALLPELPRSGHARLAFALVAAVTLAPMGKLVADHYAAFDAQTQDFTAIKAAIPRAPKLLYLIVDHHGASARHPPFIHLPAYVQAEKGGWLSFHFALWGASPVRYRPRDEPGAIVPPKVPLRWEWTPERFQVLEHGPFFDWFLVRARRSPAFRFAADPSIELVARRGDWWLYARR